MENIPIGYCHCGCGSKTPLSKINRPNKGVIKGQPTKFIRGHVGRLNAIKSYEKKIVHNPDGSIVKLCTCCGIHKQIYPNSCFNNSARGSDRYRTWCKDCERLKANEFYHKNPDSYKKRAGEYSKKLHASLLERANRIKTTYGCRACGESEVCCLDFHHLLTKKRSVGNAKTVKSFEQEIVKCVVLCANCHRKTHAGILHVSLDQLCKPFDGLV